MAGDTAKARVAYQDFFNIWKDADQTFDPERSQGRIREVAIAGRPPAFSFAFAGSQRNQTINTH